MTPDGAIVASTIVVNYNGAHLLPACLESLAAQDMRGHEVLVVDNGSIDDSAATAARYACRFIPLGGNFGLPAAYNRGAEQARGRYLFFVNNDMRFNRDCVRLLVEALEKDDTAFASDPLQYDWDGSRVIHQRPILRPVRTLRELLANTVVPWPPMTMIQVPCDVAVPTPWGCAGCLMIRRPMFAAVGGWDEKLFIDFEDVDLCWRAWLRGWPTLYVPQARLHHKWGATNDEQLHRAKDEAIRRQLPSITFRRLVSQQRNHLRVVAKVLGFPAAAVLFAIKLAVLPIMAVRHPRVAHAWVRGFARALGEIPEISRLRREIRRTQVVSNRALKRRFLADGRAALAPETRTR